MSAYIDLLFKNCHYASPIFKVFEFFGESRIAHIHFVHYKMNTQKCSRFSLLQKARIQVLKTQVKLENIFLNQVDLVE